MNVISILFLILLYFFKNELNIVYSYILGKILIFLILLYVFLKNNIVGFLLICIFLFNNYSSFNLKSVRIINTPLKISKTSVYDLEKYLKPIDSKKI